MRNGHPDNNFDFWRILAAAMVLFSHQFALLGKGEPSSLIPGGGFGFLGVSIFFSVSGFLVAQSWLGDPHVFRFIQRRFLRIWPALIVVICLAALVLGPLVSTLPASAYFGSPETLHYFKNLVLNIKYELPGVFAANPFPRAVNGSLWTIPVEVRWYWVTLIAGVAGLLKFRWVVLIAMFGLAIYHFGIFGAETNPKRVFGIEYGLFFVYGVCLTLFRDLWEGRVLRLALALAGVAVLFAAFGHALIALWVVLPFAVIASGVASTPVIRRFGRFGDLSYGFYIYAFPVQQTIVWWTNASLSVPASLALSASVTTVLAYLSWHLVEKPALKLKPRATAPAPVAQLAV